MLLASVLLSGWPAGLRPNLEYPFNYSGDALGVSFWIQRLIEGGLSENARSGYPFGSSMMDYPTSDSGNLMLLRLFGRASGSWFGAFNLFVLLSFALTFFCAFCVLRSIGLEQPLAGAAAMLFCFLPFQFLRLLWQGHLPLLACFVVPIYYYCGFYFWRNRSAALFAHANRLESVLIFLTLLILPCFGVYYALFGVILLASVAALIGLTTGSIRRALPAALAIAAVCLAVVLNVLPSIVHKNMNGLNAEVAQRQPQESDIYGLRFSQMLLPRSEHRVPRLAEIAEGYARDFPLITENSTAATGLIGSMGLVILGASLLAAVAGCRWDGRLTLLAAIVLALFLTGTVGGLGSVFAITVTPIIRAWNRISIFISFGALAAFFLAVQLCLYRYSGTTGRKATISIVALTAVLIGILDQTVPANPVANRNTREHFLMDRDFVQSIEAQLTSGSAIYQLPYVGFPEMPLLHGLNPYSLLTGFLHSKTLCWSHGGMKGRSGDLFYRRLSQEPLEKQLSVIRELGFAGIYVDRRGYADKAEQTILKISHLLGQGPSLQRADGEITFFRISPEKQEDFANMNTGKVLAQASRIAGYLLPSGQEVAFNSPILSFSKWSQPEAAFRWSEGKECSVEFVIDESVEDFSRLVVKGAPLGAQRLSLVLNGEMIYKGTIAGGQQALGIELPPRVLARGGNQLIFHLPDARAAGNGDPRTLGFALESLSIE